MSERSDSHDYEDMEISNNWHPNTPSSFDHHFMANEANGSKLCTTVAVTPNKSSPATYDKKLLDSKMLVILVFNTFSNIAIVVSLVIVAMVHIRLSSTDLSTKVPHLKFLKREVSLLLERVANISGDLKKQSEIVQILTTSRKKFSSCTDILNNHPSSPSGNYTLMLGSGQLKKKVYCDMTKTCGNITGGWMRVAQLDTQNCPPSMFAKMFNEIQTCVVENDSPGCTPVIYSTLGVPYSKVCGKIRGYGIGTIDGFDYRLPSQKEVFSNYLDGVSLTSDTNHVWSFAAGSCGCDLTLPQFIQNDYTCDGQTCLLGAFCGDFLWNSTLCGRNTPFLKSLPHTTTSDIMMRVCRDESRSNEDIAITGVDIYVQ